MTLSDSIRSLALYFFLGNVHTSKDSFQYYRFPDGRSEKVERGDIPPCPPNHLRIVVLSDTHNRHDRLGPMPKCDLFVHCGDILMTGKKFSRQFQLSILQHFDEWIGRIPAEKKLVVAGNHDDILFKFSPEERKRLFKNAHYLENESLVWKGAHIWASPISYGSSPNKAFQSPDFENEVLNKLPSKSVDILITHGLHSKVLDEVKHNIHLFGHNHNSYGIYIEDDRNGENVDDCDSGSVIAKRVSVCAPICDGLYRLNQLPFIIDYPLAPTDDEVKTSATTMPMQQIPESQSIDTSMEQSKVQGRSWQFWWSKSKVAPEQ